MERFGKVKGPVEGALRRRERGSGRSWRAGWAPLDRARLGPTELCGYLP